MITPETAQRPAPLARALTALIEHSQRWGMLWFGLLFWGSVLSAIGSEVWPDVDSLAVGAVAAAVGLAGGVTAKVRGRWI